ncbi:uncharacterized protein LOC133903204 [Phragmites australis]|uniref:uncharacterized protein LOC133903204 n=1 Tax=Phragmites australis TaxID=29695 RepID=UPI002D76DCD4|nr:uncharacterized protein LOC133903204 [Phragmites australis]
MGGFSVFSCFCFATDEEDKKAKKPKPAPATATTAATSKMPPPPPPDSSFPRVPTTDTTSYSWIRRPPPVADEGVGAHRGTASSSSAYGRGREISLAPHPPPANHPARSIQSIAAELGPLGRILLLFETPSGFAIFSFPGILLYVLDAIESIWAHFSEDYKARKILLLKEFKTFDDKSSAINLITGVNKKLTEMILKWRCPGQKLAVGKPEYKRIIETSLKIPCLCDEAVMEVMWGLKNLMRRLVPKEKSELTKEDCLPMSEGLKKVLSRYGFDDVKPEMVNERIIVTACALFDCDSTEKKHSACLRCFGDHIKGVSGIDCEDWSLLKLATAFKVIFCPEVGDYHEMLSKDELSKLVDDAHKYTCKIGKVLSVRIYKEMVSAHEVRTKEKILLGHLVVEAKEAYENGKANERRNCCSWGST